MQRGGGSTGGSSLGRQINLEEIWSDLEGGISNIFTNDREVKIPRARYMELYT